MQLPPEGSKVCACAGVMDMRVAIPAAAIPDAIRVAMRAISIVSSCLVWWSWQFEYRRVRMTPTSGATP
jgi:hypothetical protein